MEGGLIQRRRETVSHVNKVSYGNANKMIKKKKYKTRTKKSAPKGRTTLQQLYDSCRNVFKGHGMVPLPSDEQKLCHILNNMKPEDVGLSEELQFFKPKSAVKGTPRVTYATIHQCDKFSLCIFFLPATAVIPLHNHPGMTVFSKLLLGKMHIKSYDWVDPANSDNSAPSSQLRLARLKADSVFTAPCNTNVLYPTTGGNIHAFTAITPCAVLDVLGPPYSKEDGRDCSYYTDYPYTAFSNGETPVAKEEGDNYGWLEEIDIPENSKMYGIDYLGPQVMETSD